MVEGEEKIVIWKEELNGDKVKGKDDRILIEIVEERKIEENIKESMMERGIKEIVKVVVIEEGEKEFMRCGREVIGEMLKESEKIIEMKNERIGENKSRIVERKERDWWKEIMKVIEKIVEKCGNNIVEERNN